MNQREIQDIINKLNSAKDTNSLEKLDVVIDILNEKLINKIEIKEGSLYTSGSYCENCLSKKMGDSTILVVEEK